MGMDDKERFNTDRQWAVNQANAILAFQAELARPGKWQRAPLTDMGKYTMPQPAEIERLRAAAERARGSGSGEPDLTSPDLTKLTDGDLKVYAQRTLDSRTQAQRAYETAKRSRGGPASVDKALNVWTWYNAECRRIDKELTVRKRFSR